MLKDPRKQYYSEEFPEQDHQHPQTQAVMKPLPDCGEESYQGSGQLKGRNALITGGDSGIGRAVAIAYAREGANVAIQYLPDEEVDAQEVKALIEAEGVKALLLAADFRQDGAAAQTVKDTIKAFGAVDILVINAAQQIAKESLADISLQQFKDTFQVKLYSMFEILKAAEDHLEPGAAIITTTSSQSFNPSPTLLDYAAANAAITNFTVNLAAYYTPKGIRINGVAPGPVWTPLQLDGGQISEKAMQKFGQSSKTGRAGQPVELAPVYVFLASDKASFVSGQIYGITGGKPIN